MTKRDSKAKKTPWDERIEEAAIRFDLNKAQIAKLRRRAEDAFLEEIAKRIATRSAHRWLAGAQTQDN